MKSALTRILFRFESAKKLIGILTLSVIVSMIDVVTLVLVFPIFLITARSSMNVGEHMPEFLAYFVGDEPGPKELYWLGAALVAIIVIKNLATVLLYRIQVSAASNGVIRLSRMLARSYLAAPLEFHLGRKNAQYIRGLRDLPGAIYYQGALSYCNLIAEVGGVVVLTLALAFFEPTGVFFALLFLGTLVFLNHRFMGGLFERWGRRTATLLRQTYALIGQIFPSIKVVKAAGAEPYLFERFAIVQAEGANIEANRRFAQMSIRPVSEIVMMLAAVIIVAATLAGKTRAIEALPFVAVFAFGAIRLLPSINRISMYVNEIKSVQIAAEELQTELDSIGLYIDSGIGKSRSPTIRFSETLELRRVGYTYPDGKCQSLSDIDLTIHYGEVLGLAGTSGAGKSTLVDIFLGLLRPTAGIILTDGAPPDDGENQGTVGYVPQNSLLINATVRENIAFGVRSEEIVDAQVWKAVKAASLVETVERLSEGLDTEVGEFGSKLSGGERQRIGIARALYGQPCLLILDEATSDLDAETEFEVTSAINDLRKKCTIVVVAHRMHLLKNCDRVIFMKEGRIDDVGSYEELLANCAGFRDLANVVDRYGH